MNDHAALRDELVKWIPNLRAFALSLTQSAQHSDDLVQDTLVKALSNLDKFQMGTNLRAWLFTILRNSFYNGIRYRKYHQTAPLDEVDPGYLELRATQEKYIEFQDVLNCLGRLPRAARGDCADRGRGAVLRGGRRSLQLPGGHGQNRLSRARQRLEEYSNGEKTRAEPVP